MMILFMVYEQSKITRAGYEISRLSQDETKLVEQLRILNVHVNRLCQPEFIEQQVRQMQIDLMRAPEPEIVPVSTTSADDAE